jgi:hypothetical protein
MEACKMHRGVGIPGMLTPRPMFLDDDRPGCEGLARLRHAELAAADDAIAIGFEGAGV